MRMKALLLGILAVLAIAGCGGGRTDSTVARHHAPPRELELEELEEEFTPRPPPHPQRLARPCGPEQLVVSHEGGADSAMSTYHTRFMLFNLSERACSISGYPKLFALRVGGRVAEGPAPIMGPGPTKPPTARSTSSARARPLFRRAGRRTCFRRESAGRGSSPTTVSCYPGPIWPRPSPIPISTTAPGGSRSAGSNRRRKVASRRGRVKKRRHLVGCLAVTRPTLSSGRESATPAAPRRGPPTGTSK